jgi:glycosyltransferase involved in cell wall biosynthesis
MNSPLISVVIPAYGRIAPLRDTLRSALRAADALAAGQVEIVLVDDGSPEPLGEVPHPEFHAAPLRHLRQANAGSVVARAHGLAVARGEFIQFLDSDDLIHPEKLAAHLALHQRTGADVVYCEHGSCEPTTAGESTWRAVGRLGPPPVNPAEFWLNQQPAPHAPTYRRAWLQAALTAAARAAPTPTRAMDPAGDVWLYYSLLGQPVRLAHLDAPWAATGVHPEIRYSQHWERLGTAALIVAEAHAPRLSRLTDTREVLGRRALHTWRALPHDLPLPLAQRWVMIWRACGQPPWRGGPLGKLAMLLGTARAVQLVRRWRGVAYAECRTEDAAGLACLAAQLTETKSSSRA